MGYFSKLFVLAFCMLFLVHCGNKKLELQCGCEKSDRNQYLVSVRMSGDNIVSNFLRELEFVQQEERGIYGVCFEQSTDTVYFCSEGRSDYRELEDRFPDLNFRDEPYE